MVYKQREKERAVYCVHRPGKAYGKTCREELWRALHECGVEDSFVRSMSHGSIKWSI